jgi:hypothetical protein
MTARDHLLDRDDPEWNKTVDEILAEHRVEVLAGAAAIADRLVDDLATGRVGALDRTAAFWQADGVRILKGQLGKGTGTPPADTHAATRDEPEKATADDGQFDRTDWVSCSHRACPSGEYRAKASERGWTTSGHAGAWLCTTHTPGGGQ